MVVQFRGDTHLLSEHFGLEVLYFLVLLAEEPPGLVELLPERLGGGGVPVLAAGRTFS